MRRLCVFLFIITAAFGLLPAIMDYQRKFIYPVSKLLHNQSKLHQCTICDHSSCLRMDNAMCEYHKVTGEILKNENADVSDENPALKAEVDDLLFEMTKEDMIASTECTPYISHYTNCHKHNICLGCRECDCDAAGMWSCVNVQRCHSDVVLDVDHRVLVEVMENLKSYEIEAHVRKKRSKNNTTVMKADEGDEKLTSEEIMTLINGPNQSISSFLNNTKESNYVTTNTGDKKFNNEILESIGKKSKTISNDIDPLSNNEWESVIESEESTVFTTVAGNEFQNISDLDFNELLPLQNTLTDENSTIIHLPMLKSHTEDVLEPDYMDIPDETITQSNNINKTDENVLSSEENSLKVSKQNFTQKEEKKMIFYADLGKDFKALTKFPKEDEASDNSDTNDINDKQTVHIVKRETPNVIPNDKIPIVLNYSNNYIHSLIEDLFVPLYYIVTEKRNELRKLEEITNNVMKLIKMYSQNETFLNASHEILNTSNTAYLSIYKLESESYLENNTANSTDPTYLDNYAFKLENDIYEVIKDIVEMQKNTNFKALPEDLKVLIRAMKYYIHKQRNLIADQEMKKLPKFSENIRRKSYMVNVNRIVQMKVTDIIKQMLYAIDQEMPLSNALAPLSVSATKIVKRIIKKYYHNKFPVPYTHISDNSDNINRLLKDLGTKWYDMTNKIASSSLEDKLFNMKLLHLEISRDICKIRDALSLIEVLTRRHTFIINEHAFGKIASKIKEDIQIINNKFKDIVKIQNTNIAHPTNNNTITKPKILKDSYLKQLKKNLKHSKTNLRKLLTDKFRYLNRQHKDNGSQSIQKMDIPEKIKATFSRRKRLAGNYNFTNVVKRIRNIIPNYLKNKFNVATNSKSSMTKL